jgi:biopolymer transport protein ExbB/TolQ
MGLGATIESWTMWLVIICGVFVLISGIKVVDLAHNYERLLERYNQLDEDYRKIKEDKQTKDNKEEKEEKEEPFANVSTEWLLAEKEKHKHNKSFVKMVDDVLEIRAKNKP